LLTWYGLENASPSASDYCWLWLLRWRQEWRGWFRLAEVTFGGNSSVDFLPA
jgi:hypothetical protein